MRNEEFSVDVLISGAGMAGVTAGFLLSRLGADVSIIERNALEKKNKLCGGMLGSDAIHALQSVYGDSLIDALKPLFFKSRRYQYRNNEMLLDSPSHALPRKRLDNYCLHRYLDLKGVCIDESEIVKIRKRGFALCINTQTKSSFIIKYKSLLGADGVRSKVRHLYTGSYQKCIPAIQSTVEYSNGIPVFRHNADMLGYCWYIPTGENASVGCMTHSTTRPLACSMRNQLREFCSELAIKPPIFKGALIPAGNEPLLRVEDDAWLIGDAAGLIDPKNGGGIHYAVISAAAIVKQLAFNISYTETMATYVKHIKESHESIVKHIAMD